jgi:hypothetical protein
MRRTDAKLVTTPEITAIYHILSKKIAWAEGIAYQ